MGGETLTGKSLIIVPPKFPLADVSEVTDALNYFSLSSHVVSYSNRIGPYSIFTVHL